MTWGCRITGAMVTWEQPNGTFSLTVDELQVAADQGCKIPVVGRTASGKSTLLSLMAGLKWPIKGEICWTFPDRDKSVQWTKTSIPTSQEWVELRQRYFGFAFQNRTLLPHLNIWNNLTYPLELRGISNKEARKEARAMLALMLLPSEKAELANLLNRFPHEISGGQYQRIALAQSVIHKPKVLFADEPTGSLDLRTRLQVMQALEEWLNDEAYKGQRMLIWVTHHDNDPQVNDVKQLIYVKSEDGNRSSCSWKTIESYNVEMEKIKSEFRNVSKN